MQAGVLYNISLYIEEASGVSDPAFGQVYSKEESKFMRFVGLAVKQGNFQNVYM